MKFKRSVVSAALLGAAAFSGSAFAGATANVGAFSDYMFRGVTQSSGAAVQGGLDYASDSGFYVGMWGSNLSFAGAGSGTEVDVYGGFAGKLGESVGFDLGALYYWYSEEDETAAPGAESLNTIELYAGLSFGPVGAKYYFTNEYFGSDESASYLNFTLALPLSETVNLTANVGLNDGDGVEAIFGDTYTDYSLGLAKSVEGGYTATFQFIATDLDGGGVDDDPKFVIGLKKVFDL